MRLARLAPLVVVSSLGIAACGGDSGSSGTIPADATLVVHAVDGIAWNAKNYTAASGEVKLWAVNDSSIAHNMHVRSADGKDVAKGVNLPSKGSKGDMDVTLTPGTYEIVCLITGHNNMKATLTVT